MTDLIMCTAALALLGSALALAIAMRAFGVASTYIRDFLHIGAGVWVLGWPYWHDAALPTAMVLVIAVATSFMPALAPRNAIARHIVGSVTNGDEHWSGLVLYTVAFALFTAIGLAGDRFAAGAALLALSLGDGIGGAAGRAFGDLYFRAPGGKQKSFEGSAVVLLGGFVAAVIAAVLFGESLGMFGALGIGVTAAVVEALSPRGTDNLFLPVAVYVTAHVIT